VITWSSGDRLLTGGPVTCSLFISSFSPFPGRDVITWSSGDRLHTAGQVFSFFLSFSPFPGRAMITWTSGDQLKTAGPVTCSLSILVSLLFQVEMLSRGPVVTGYSQLARHVFSLYLNFLSFSR
jgi:hypothetical protein